MICFEHGATYQMKGCTHTICMNCANKMKKASDAYPYVNVFTLTEGSVRCLKCPYCRQKEPVDITLNIPSVREYLSHQFDEFSDVVKDLYQWNTREIADEFLNIYDYPTTHHRYTQYTSELCKSYKLWMDLELRFDGEKSTITIKYKRYWDGKKRSTYRKWTVYKGEISLKDFIISNHDYKHQKNVYITPRTRVKIKDLRRMKRF